MEVSMQRQGGECIVECMVQCVWYKPYSTLTLTFCTHFGNIYCAFLYTKQRHVLELCALTTPHSKNDSIIYVLI